MGSTCEGERVCWVCLCGEGDSDQPLVVPCRCQSRPVHTKCLARWQLQSAGKAEERTCRFCNATLPDWRPALTPANLRPATPVVSVHFNGTCYRLKVKPGAEGFQQFRRQLQKITGFPALETMQITFQCRAPDTAQELSFKGISAFDAAIHCAAVSAAERLSQQQQKAAAAAAMAAAAAHCDPDGVAGCPLAPAASSSSDAGISSTSGSSGSVHATPSGGSFSSQAGPSSFDASSLATSSSSSSSSSTSSSPTAAGAAARRAVSLDAVRAPHDQQQRRSHDMHSVVHHHHHHGAGGGGREGAAVGGGQGSGGERVCAQEHGGALARVRDAFRRLLAIS